MPFSESLASRTRDALTRRKGISERKMFGCLCFLLRGKLLVGVFRDSMIVRLGPQRATEVLCMPNVEQFGVAGRPMKGWVVVKPEGIDSDRQLTSWIEQAVEFVDMLPEK